MSEAVTWSQVGVGFVVIVGVIVVLWVLYRILSAYGDAWKH
jgi:hypothetical protein